MSHFETKKKNRKKILSLMRNAKRKKNVQKDMEEIVKDN